MKKTISINLNGQIFNIEEDGYDKLKNYLSALTKYFSSYGDSKEILTDIEGRIAEKFDDYLKKEEKQAITINNIDSLISSMGTVADFEAIKEEEDLANASLGLEPEPDFVKPPTSINEEAKAQANTNAEGTMPPLASQKLYRDGQRKLLGGVCAGLAHYFKMDVIWIRLLFLGMLGFVPLLAGFSAAIFLVYIACWIAFPVNNNLAEDENIKKFFRDSDRKVLGGVASGLAKYTGIDLGLMRLIFVLGIFLAGTGVMVYIILWAITPFAKTITERMQMKGEAITIENIESNIKNAKNFSPQNESALTSILLLPFRLIGKFFSALAPLFSVSGSIIRILAGVLVLIIGVIVVISLIVALFSGLGAFGNLPIGQIDGMPLYRFDAPKIMFLFIFAAIVVPFVILALAGLSLVSRKNQFSGTTWQILGGMFLAGVLGSALSISKYAGNFQYKSKIETTTALQPTVATPTFDVIENDDDENFLAVHYYLKPSSDNQFRFEQKYQARGSSEQVAQKYAQGIKFNFTQKDSLISLGRNFGLAESAPFRRQDLFVNILVPQNKPFIITRRLAHQIHNINLDWDTINWENGVYHIEDHAAARFIFKEDGTLQCLDSKVTSSLKEGPISDEDYGYHKEFVVQDFDDLEIAGVLKVELSTESNNKISASANDSENMDKLKFNQNGRKIFLDAKEADIVLKISAKDLKNILLSDEVRLDLKNGNFQNLNIKMRNQAMADFQGNTNEMNIDIADESQLWAKEFSANNINIEARNTAKATINVKSKLNAKAQDEAKIEYMGNAGSIQLNPSGNSEILKYKEEE